jgi:hypothetical protein
LGRRCVRGASGRGGGGGGLKRIQVANDSRMGRKFELDLTKRKM